MTKAQKLGYSPRPSPSKGSTAFSFCRYLVRPRSCLVKKTRQLEATLGFPLKERMHLPPNSSATQAILVTGVETPKDDLGKLPLTVTVQRCELERDA